VSYSQELADILSNVTKSTQPTAATIDDGIRVYMLDYFRRGCSPRTMFTAYVDLRRFAEDVAHFDNDGKPMPLERVNRHVIEAHLSRLSLGQEVKCTKKPSIYTVERRRRVVKAFLRWLHDEEYMQHNPTKKLSSISLRERFPSVWSLEDVERFLQTFDKSDLIGHRNFMLALVGLSSGLRAGELAHLRPIDANLKARTLSVSEKGKTGARTAVMPGETALQLSVWLRRRQRELKLSDTAPLFPAIGFTGNVYGVASHEPMRANSISRIIAKHAKKAGISGVKLGSHALRHTAATFLAQRGASAFEIQRFLGHSSIEMSQRYVAMSNEAVQRRVEEDGILAQLGQRQRQHDIDSDVGDRQAVLKRILASR
jgi:site-specific recombinase XerD